MGAGGALYGTTTAGGTAQIGTAFQLAPPAQADGTWIESLIWQFQGGADGEHPEAALTPGPNGTFYGTTLSGGANNLGTVFQLIPPSEQGGAWTEVILRSFKGAKDGQGPGASVIVSANGSLYGTTESAGGSGGSGGGTVYHLSPPSEAGGAWTNSTIYTFKGQPNDGAIPNGAVCLGKNGKLFGVTEEGGSHNKGTVFELTPPAQSGEAWTETVLHNFSGTDGAYPYFGLTLAPSGVLFGTTQSGGPNGNGTIFELTVVSGNWRSDRPSTRGLAALKGILCRGPALHLSEPGLESQAGSWRAWRDPHRSRRRELADNHGKASERFH